MAELAINGGKKAVEDWIPTPWPIFDDREKEALIETLESGRWCCTWSLEGKVGQFGQEFAEYIGTKYGTCVNSGTSALNLAFRVCDVEPGDEVIVIRKGAYKIPQENLEKWTLLLREGK